MLRFGPFEYATRIVAVGLEVESWVDWEESLTTPSMTKQSAHNSMDRLWANQNAHSEWRQAKRSFDSAVESTNEMPHAT